MTITKISRISYRWNLIVDSTNFSLKIKYQVSYLFGIVILIVVLVVCVVLLVVLLVVVIIIIVLDVLDALDVLVKTRGLYQVPELSYGASSIWFSKSCIMYHGAPPSESGI